MKISILLQNVIQVFTTQIGLNEFVKKAKELQLTLRFHSSPIMTLRTCAINPIGHKLGASIIAFCLLHGVLHSAAYASTESNATKTHANHAAQSNESLKQVKSPVAIAIHGGAGTILKKNMTPEQEAAYLTTLSESVKKGYEALLAGKDGTQAVIDAIVHMENSALFNAGVGAVYTYTGEHELDASIMHGQNKEAGAVAGVKTIQNPILAALLVMEKSEHVMLTGNGAETFASQHGLSLVDNSHFNTKRRYDALQRAKKRIVEQAQHQTSAMTIDEKIAFQDFKFGTVGAVVLDANGNIVAGTSTGGMTAKRFGRIGDSSIIGAGTFADNESCAVSATGHGEYFIRHNVAADICARMKYKGTSLETAANEVIFEVLNSEAGSGGIIAIDHEGNIAMPFNTAGMYRASIDVDGKLSVKIYKD
jgi:beta-aspartyl-peptidase (threonine type)